MPRLGSSLDPDAVELVALALARCRERILAQDRLSEYAEERESFLSRYLMRRAQAGERDIETLVKDALNGLRLRSAQIAQSAVRSAR